MGPLRRPGIGLQRLLLAVVIAALMFGSATATAPTVSASSCVTISGATWNASTVVVPAAGQNRESVRIKNACSTTQRIGGWILHDYARRNTFVFPAAFGIGPGVTVTVHAGTGTATATSLWWKKRYGVVWGGRSPDRVEPTHRHQSC